MVSLKDIAKECQVSVATVSKALNDHADISEERKKMIRENGISSESVCEDIEDESQL